MEDDIPKPTTAGSLIRWGAAKLKDSSETASLDAKLLLQDILTISKLELFTEPHREVTLNQVEKYAALISRRIQHEPLAYILGKKYFWENEFIVTPAVLIPRPDTETLVEAAILDGRRQIAEGKKSLSIVDLGTGSGCIGISVAQALSEHVERLVLLDSSDTALEVCKQNVKKILSLDLQQKTEIIFSRWFERLTGSFDSILSNPPYIEPFDPRVYPGARYEPQGALYSDNKGLKDLFEVIEQGVTKVRPKGSIYIEFGMGQETEIAKFLERYRRNFSFKFYSDLSNMPRVVSIHGE